MAAALRHSSAALASALRSSSTSSTSTSSTSSSFLLRFFSTSPDSGGGEGSVHFDDGSGEKLAEVLDHALAKEKPNKKSSESSSPDAAAAAATASAILTTRREALSLYRSIWRATALFTWSTDSKNSPLSPTGEPWRDALRRSARQEFESSKQFERDPVAIARMLVVGRDAVAQAVDRLAAKAAKVEKGLRSGGGGRGGGEAGRGGGDGNGGSRW